MNHINEMAKTGKPSIAGPIEGGGKHRGILIFDVDSISQAIRIEISISLQTNGILARVPSSGKTSMKYSRSLRMNWI